MTTPRPLWTLDGVTLEGAPRSRLSCVSAAIPAGRTAVLGQSGAGKTSLLNVLVGYERPHAGRIERGLSESSRLAVFWSPGDGGLWPHVSVLDHLRLVAPRSSAGQAESLLARFDLAALADRRADDLSAGERSRLSVARALATEADVLVLDEPLAHVDGARLDRYWDVVRGDCDSRGTSLVFSSHQPEIVLAHAEQVVCLEEGRIAWSGPVQTLYESPPSESLGWCLGPLNWFEPDEGRLWLGRSSARSFGVRPSRLSLTAAGEADDAGPVVELESLVPLGTVARASVRRLDGASRTVHVRAVDRLASGAAVVLKALLGLMTAVWLAGCSRETAGAQQIPTREIHTWQLPSEGARMPTPRGLHVNPDGQLMVLDDAGRLMIYDEDRNLVSKCWMPEYSVGRPEGLWVMLDGRIAIADTHYNRVLLLAADGSLDSMFGEKGERAGQFIFPETVIQDPQGRLYVCEYGGNDRIQRFSTDGEWQASFGSFGTEPGQLQRPTGLVWHDNSIYVCDAVNNRVQEFTEDGQFVRVVADAESSGLYYPYDMAISPEGELFVVEFGSGRVTRLSLDGRVLGRIGMVGRNVGEFWTPWGVAVAQDGRVFIADTGNRRLVEVRL
ncbi:MAG: ATP-binding cassette domain-containing protein [Planctomyces sp.]|nr:ATP-binding cassette domain-containing protein [Planctomyces sp.]